jgi:putative nucleotidyltransferase with HDIG domain
MLTRFEIRERIASAQLPTPPAAVGRLLQLLGRDSTTAEDIAGALALDPGLATRVLRMANSAALGGGSEVNSIPDAVLRIGVDGIRNMVVSLGLVSHLKPKHCDYRAFWRHSLAVAHTAATLQSYCAKLTGPIEATYAAGLLHDIGIVVLDHVLGDEYANTLDTARTTGRQLCEVEVGHLSYDHTQAGEQLLQTWKLPQLLVDAVRHHHTPWVSESLILQLVHLADFICNNQGLHHGTGYFPGACCDRAWIDLGIDDKHLPSIIAETRQSLAKAEDTLRAAVS